MRDALHVLVGVILSTVMFVVILSLPTSLLYKSKQALTQCEAALPRNQHCVLTAVPAKP